MGSDAAAYEATVLTSKQLTVVLAALEEIEGAFEFVGFDTSEEEEAVGSPVSDVSNSPGRSFPEGIASEDAEEGYEDVGGEDDDYSDYFSDKEYDSEDIEVAISEFLTRLNRKRLIRKNANGRLPRFSEAFAMLFGQDSELATTAQQFEEHVEGYFGSINYENMSDAHAAFRAIVEEIKRARDGASK